MQCEKKMNDIPSENKPMIHPKVRILLQNGSKVELSYCSSSNCAIITFIKFSIKGLTCYLFC